MHTIAPCWLWMRGSILYHRVAWIYFLAWIAACLYAIMVSGYCTDGSRSRGERQKKSSVVYCNVSSNPFGQVMIVIRVRKGLFALFTPCDVSIASCERSIRGHEDLLVCRREVPGFRLQLSSSYTAIILSSTRILSWRILCVCPFYAGVLQSTPIIVCCMTFF